MKKIQNSEIWIQIKIQITSWDWNSLIQIQSVLINSQEIEDD